MPTKTLKQTKTGSAEFRQLPESYLNHIRTTYIETGKLEITRNEISENEVETVFNFASEAARQEFLQDNLVIQEKLRSEKHMQSAGIQQISNIDQN